jgi:hypothetical protein
MRTTLLRHLLSAAAASATALVAANAHAGGYVAADFDVGVPLDGSGARYALGIGGRAGWRFDLGPAWIGPQLGGGYVSYQGQPNDITDESTGAPHAARILAGLRFGMAGRVQPSFYGHVGAGWLGAHEVGPTFDAGFALDFALVPHFVFGAQLGYNVVAVWSSGPVEPGESAGVLVVARWMGTGLHAGVAF